MKRLLLISANRLRDPYPVYPLGVSYLKTYLDRHLTGFRVTIFDCNLGSNEALAAHIRTERPDYIGLSLRNADGANSFDRTGFTGQYAAIARAVRAVSSAPLIVGGSAFSLFPGEFMRSLDADYGLIGEGEESLRRLVEALERGEDGAAIEGVATLRDGRLRIQPHRCYLHTLEVDFDPALVDYYWTYSGMLNLQTKRGCPYHCVYCSYPVIDGRTVRTLDAGRVVENVARLKRDKGIDYVFFTDSVFNIADGYNAELARALIDSRAGVSWGAYFSPRNITPEAMALYKASGLTHVEFGTESLSDAALEAYGKSFSFADVLRASDICLDLNIYYAHFLILGGYGETPATLRETMVHSEKIRHSVFFPYVGMRIYPHTRLQRIAVAEGVIAPDDDLFEPRYYFSPGFDAEEARAMALATGKAWIFPDDPQNAQMEVIRLKRKRKGPLWEYLRKP